MHKGLMMAASLLGAFAVALGAFGAHGLKTILSEDALAVYHTGVEYQFYHVFAILATGFIWEKIPSKQVLWAGRLFISGIIFFSGSLYLMTWLRAFANKDILWLGAITPIGGIMFIAGWLTLGWAISIGLKDK